jgi:hypothetical protein
MKLFISIVLVLISTSLSAGDYMIYVSDSIEGDEKCSPIPNARFQIETSSNVVKGFNEYFSGLKPSVKNIKAAFSNSHFHFCGSNEIDTVLKGLYAINHAGPKKYKSHLLDFIDKVEAVK